MKKNPHKQTNYIIGAVAGAVAAIAFALLLLFGGPSDDADARAKVRPGHARVVYATCFPARLWNARPADRPCHAVTRVFEDGSGHLRLGTARRARAWCSLPSVYELKPRRTFTIRCRSNGNAGASVRPARKGNR